MNTHPLRLPPSPLLGFLAFALVFAPVITSIQVTEQRVARRTSLSNGGLQYERHREVIEGTAPSPWRYRVLSEYVVAGLIKIFERLQPRYAAPLAFITLRLAQLVLSIVLAGAYFRRLGLNTFLIFLGLAILAYAFTLSNHYSDFASNTYTDLIAYLCAGLLILTGRYFWILPLTVLAAMNRETSGLIPIMLFAEAVRLGLRQPEGKRTAAVAAVAMLVFGITYLTIRRIYGPAGIFIPYGHYPGFDLLRYNLLARNTYTELFASFGIIPILALLSLKYCPPILRGFFWSLVPLWILAHLFTSVWAEARLFLVPFTIVLLPATLAGADYWCVKSASERQQSPANADAFN